MKNDAQLLRDYVENRSQIAFTELVHRHLGLVYSVALRRVGGDAHLAEDVVQNAFADLARKAPSLLDRPALGGWLFTSAHHASAAIVRRERRRKAREIQACSMQTTSSFPEPETDWTRLRPVIDDAVVALKNDDREAIVLRFFERRSFAEIGAVLRLTEEAARKRTDRALDKLRLLLVQRGITSTGTALGLTLTGIGATTPPAGLGGKVAIQALVGAPSTTSLINTIVGTTWPAAAAFFIGALVVTSQSRINDALRGEIAQLATENTSLAALQNENAQLARDIALLATEPARAPAPSSTLSAPATEASPMPRHISAQITLSPKGTIAWNSEPLSLRDFITRLRTLQTVGDPEGRVHIDAAGASFLPLTYVIEEVRKAQLNHVTVESAAAADPAQHPQWFWF